MCSAAQVSFRSGAIFGSERSLLQLSALQSLLGPTHKSDASILQSQGRLRCEAWVEVKEESAESGELKEGGGRKEGACSVEA